MIYRRRASPLHAARASIGVVYCAALVAVALSAQHPLVLAGVLVAVITAGALAGVGAEMRRSARWWVGTALLLAAIYCVTNQNGLSVILRGPDLPWFGEIDITLEALLAGALLGLLLMDVGLAAALASAAIDPDELLRAMRRRSSHSALAATLATRLWPVLSRDSSRLAEAQRCLSGGRALTARERVGVVRAVTTGALERAIDVAATLELRGYATAARPQRASKPLSRHDFAFGAAAAALVVLAALLATGPLARFDALPAIRAGSWPEAVAVACAVPAIALAPFIQRRGIA